MVKLCGGVGCDRKAVSRGLCDKHYRRLMKHGNAEYVKTHIPSWCYADNCDKFSVSKGLCDKHYRRLLKHNDPNWVPPTLSSECSVNECGRKRVAKGFCSRHYEQNRQGVEFESAKIVRDSWDGICEICKTDVPSGPKKSWCLDHDHQTGQARGILCAACNVGLGMFKDNVDILDSAMKYLLQHKDVLFAAIEPETGGENN